MKGVIRIALPALAVCALLNGCGLAETGAAAAAGGASAAEQAKQAKATEDKVRRDIEAAQKAADENLKAAEQAVE